MKEKDCRAKSRKNDKSEREPKVDLANIVAFVEADVRRLEEGISTLERKDLERNGKYLALQKENEEMKTCMQMLEEKIVQLENASNEKRMQMLEEKIVQLENASNEKRMQMLEEKIVQRAKIARRDNGTV